MSQARNQLRIVGGEYRRRVLRFPDAEGLRPTPDRVRETLFNWLGQDLTGKTCLDLFAGSGALGFEAASRNARRVVMVEKAKPVHAALQVNRQLLGATHIELVHADAAAWLARCTEQFDVVFLDPPFASDLLVKTLTVLPVRLNEGALVYAECAQRPDLKGWEILREGKAGTVHYALLRHTD
ncbi:16S rRNA (guanine(966)-N(2))-methyltransferase RsmD [Chitiniphilus eburneus]|uniref:16S rRNA (Guanine(966)-N(2))-methyltransferase RsmD n=1 Tax=Chitiniphilus eburneus TaxID=2571148 RepID=A0A4U0Q8N1_9NEIS|nr:16S rRNA (guanine(966)-N(2))-methyltransferase RsmD [Chitiniphilus eburneus]TJZ77637.1 16S rRNA (guanine(966)-N(2))-methyltransferase RsmD [Chitiniphilus eburneus]